MLQLRNRLEIYDMFSKNDKESALDMEKADQNDVHLGEEDDSPKNTWLQKAQTYGVEIRGKSSSNCRR